MGKCFSAVWRPIIVWFPLNCSHIIRTVGYRLSFFIVSQRATTLANDILLFVSFSLALQLGGNSWEKIMKFYVNKTFQYWYHLDENCTYSSCMVTFPKTWLFSNLHLSPNILIRSWKISISIWVRIQLEAQMRHLHPHLISDQLFIASSAASR